MPVTIKQIAETSGFSVPTVSQVLNNKGHLYRAETRETIFRVARELGYRPNSFRWALRTGRFNNLGLLIPEHDTGPDGHGFAWTALADSLARRDMHLTVGSVPQAIDPEDPASTPKMLREWSVDGLMIACGPGFPADLRKLIDEHRIPSIEIGVRRKRDCVFGDEPAAIVEVVAEFARLGHERIAYIDTAGAARPGAAERLSAFRKAAEQRPAQTLCPDEAIEVSDRLAACRTLLGDGQRPTAALAATAEDALTLLYAAARQELDVPGDLSVVVLAGRPVTASGLTVDRLGVDDPALLEHAADLLLRRIEQPGRSLAAKKLPLTRHGGQTLAPARN
jgi:LacI family transcriptional regulator